MIVVQFRTRRGPDTGDWKLIFAVLILWPTLAYSQDWGGPTHQDFEHLPLLYEGPDPTADHFLFGPPLPAPPPSESLPGFPAGLPLEVVPFEEPPMALLPGPETVIHPGQPAIRDHKDGFFQKVSFSALWINRSRADSFGLTELDLFGMFALPMPSREWPLVLIPTFNVRYLDGPTAPDLPPRLYETYLEFLWLPRVSERWTGILSVAPSYYGDFEVDEDAAWRLTGKGLARFDWVPERLQLLFGVLYLNRDDVRLLPAGGLIWTPTDGRRYELIFPRPKLAHRIQAGPRFEDWLYLGSEFGGNSWAYEEAGTSDVVTLRDYRIFLGLERKLDGGAGYRIEIGYVFSRKAEFRSGAPVIQPPSTAMLRAGVTF